MLKLYVAHCLLAATLASGVAVAQDAGPPGLAFDGTARTGTDTRPVRFRFFCSSNEGPNLTGVLSMELVVPQYEQLRSIFDFIPFEGPDARAGKLTRLQTSGAHGKADDRFTAAGSAVEAGAEESFVLEVTASRREAAPLRKLAAVLRPLADGPGMLVWQQGNAKPHGETLTASLDMTAMRSDQLKAALGPCLAGGK